MASLAGLADGDTIKFPRLQKVLGMTGGNLITHIRKLEGAGYVRSEKAGRTTTLSLTDSGRAAFHAYRQSLRDLLGSD
nr:transcriptional regulator [Spelaeicoccus albus]